MKFITFISLILSLQFTATAQYSNTPQTAMAANNAIIQKPEDISPLLTGENIPTAILKDVNNKDFDLNKAIAAKPTILVFYRGGWCPYCSRQLASLQQTEKYLMEQGYQIIAISTDSPENLKKSMSEEHLSYTLLSDADLVLAKQFGIVYRAPANYDAFLGKASGGKNVDNLLPVPSVFMLDKTGNIRFEYINPNFKQRISEGLLKAVSSTLAKEMM